ncbi:hypothetical protein DICVIV_02874 [Dictyocaulus viviparus]|uniref:Thrombospondin type 1 domain protein n=1 Tax=Dictyocaulus viviparus TaxID=29172 RepID=A0A0D8Y227_DICVI|nr:hypothetical protein DICVIV_02874 [Dictyocaulus viviparus]
MMRNAPQNSPVHIRIETDTSKSFDVGPYDRTRFDLIEQYHPLHTASIAKEEHLQELNHRAEGVKSVQSQNQLTEAFIKDSFNGDDSKPESESVADFLSLHRIVFGEWSAWSDWTPCVGGERRRIRSCSSKKSAYRIVCHGEAKQSQKCFTTQDQYIPVAKDPWTIEREITGNFKA